MKSPKRKRSRPSRSKPATHKKHLFSAGSGAPGSLTAPTSTSQPVQPKIPTTPSEALQALDKLSTQIKTTASELSNGLTNVEYVRCFLQSLPSLPEVAEKNEATLQYLM